MTYTENKQMLDNLHTAIRNAIVIPPQLSNNLAFTTTGLGGLFLRFASNTSSQLAVQNSKVSFTLYFHTTDGQGRFSGENIGLEVSRKRNITTIRGIKTPTHYIKVAQKISKWLHENAELLYSSIENKQP